MIVIKEPFHFPGRDNIVGHPYLTRDKEEEKERGKYLQQQTHRRFNPKDIFCRTAIT
jgi:hypothetical protein